jgi:ubiquinone biosynthesis protein UbiJ
MESERPPKLEPADGGARFPLSLDGRLLGAADGGLSVRALLDLAGPGGGLFLLVADGGRLGVSEVADRSLPADIHLTAAARDLEAILDGRDDAQLALRTGRLELRGDRTLALRLRQLLTPE